MFVVVVVDYDYDDVVADYDVAVDECATLSQIQYQQFRPRPCNCMFAHFKMVVIIIRWSPEGRSYQRERKVMIRVHWPASVNGTVHFHGFKSHKNIR